MDEIIGSINDPGVTAAPANEPAPASVIPDSGIIGSVHDIDPSHIETEEEHFGSPGQQIAAGLEGVAQGAIGALAPALEESAGITTGENIRAREKAHPVTHGVGEALGFVGSLAGGLGEASLAGQVGNIGEHVAAILPETVSKIAATGIKTGAEMAALAASSELSKMVEADPNQTLGSAAINVGLSGLIGGAGGVVIGSVSPLWQKAKNIIGVEKIASDFMAETKAIQEAGDPIVSATNELKGRINEADNLWKTMSESKPEVLARAMPEATPENAAKIDGQIQEISGHMEKALRSASESVKTRNAVPYLAEDFNAFQQAVSNPNATFADKFVATNKLKTTLEGYAKWGMTEEGTAKAALGRNLSNIIRPALEDTKVWGAAGDVQRVTNEAISDMIAATKDFRSQVTSKTLGEADIAPEKVQTLLNQTNAGKISRKANAVGNFLDATQKYADAINEVHLDNGLEAPLTSKLNPTPVLDRALNTPLTPGVEFARWANKRGAASLANALGESGASVVGGGLGALVGHPLAGAWLGEKALSPIFSALAKPLAETAIDSAAAKGAVDYLGSAFRGQKILDDSVSNLFTKGNEVIAKELIPDQESRMRLQKSLDYASNPSNALNVGGSIGHYLPGHATAAAEATAQATNYLSSLKPTQPALSPLDATPPVDKTAQAKYNRALDVAQQPLMVLKHVKDGTLLPQDVQTLRTIYPGLHDAMIKKITDGIIQKKTGDFHMPYSQRVSLNLLLGGNPLDSTMTSQSMQAIMHSSINQQMQQQQPKEKGKASGSTLSQINKVNDLYKTPLEARASNRR